jgi:hypothetical protein
MDEERGYEIMRNIVYLIFLALMACSTTPKPIAYQCPAIQLPPDPVTPIRSIDSHSQPGEIAKAWVATAQAYMGWNSAVREEVENIGSS